METPSGNPYSQLKPKRKLPRQGQQLPPLPYVASTIEGSRAGEVFRETGTAMVEALQQLRRNLHRHPEIGLELPRTQKTVLNALEGLALEITLGHDLCSVAAVLRGCTRAWCIV